MTEGLISVLYKKKDRNDPRNYRPITLLNGDYKILMRILTARLNSAVVQFVSAPQNGFVPGGFIVENILLLQMLQAYAEEEDIEALFIFLDFEKAFDRCSWEYLREAIRCLGFEDDEDGPPPWEPGGDSAHYHPFLRWVLLAYSHDHPPRGCPTPSRGRESGLRSEPLYLTRRKRNSGGSYYSALSTRETAILAHPQSAADSVAIATSPCST